MLNDFMEIFPPGLFPELDQYRKILNSDSLWGDIHSVLNALEKNAFKDPSLIYPGVGEGYLDFGGIFVEAGKTLQVISHSYYIGGMLESYHLLKKIYESLILYSFSIALAANYYGVEPPGFNKLEREKFIKVINLILKELESEVPTSSDYNHYLEKLELLIPEIKECREKYFKERLEEFHKVLSLYTNSNAPYNREEVSYTNSEAREEFKKNLAFVISVALIFITLIKPQLIGSGDFLEALDNGEIPISGSQFWVASSIQRYFDLYLSDIHPELAKYLKENNSLDLDINVIQPCVEGINTPQESP